MNGRAWEPDKHDPILKAWAGRITDKEIGEKTGHSERTICQRRQDLQLAPFHPQRIGWSRRDYLLASAAGIRCFERRKAAMSDSMIERVARAICKVRGHDPDADQTGPGPGQTIPQWHHFVREARAAIEAMRPTQKMAEVGLATIASWRVSDGDLGPEDITLAWNAIIDAALKEPA